MSATQATLIPRGAIMGAGVLIGLTILGVGLVQFQKFSSGVPMVAESTLSPVVSSRHIRFVDGGGGINAFGGAVTAFDADTGAKIMDLTETDGFIRAVLNSLAFERTKHQIGSETVLMLSLHADGRIWLGDPLTGTEIDLGAFGPANKAVFRRLLPAGTAS